MQDATLGEPLTDFSRVRTTNQKDQTLSRRSYSFDFNCFFDLLIGAIDTNPADGIVVLAVGNRVVACFAVLSLRGLSRLIRRRPRCQFMATKSYRCAISSQPRLPSCRHGQKPRRQGTAKAPCEPASLHLASMDSQTPATRSKSKTLTSRESRFTTGCRWTVDGQCLW